MNAGLTPNITCHVRAPHDGHRSVRNHQTFRRREYAENCGARTWSCACFC
jgi:hypothetical protein